MLCQAEAVILQKLARGYFGAALGIQINSVVDFLYERELPV